MAFWEKKSVRRELGWFAELFGTLELSTQKKAPRSILFHEVGF
jgi:hypothetical protein